MEAKLESLPEHLGASDTDPPAFDRLSANEAPGLQPSVLSDADPLSEALSQLNLEIYEQDFRDLGVEALSDFHEVQESDLTAMGMKTLEMRRFAKKFPPTRNLEPSVVSPVATAQHQFADLAHSQTIDASQDDVYDALTDLKRRSSPWKHPVSSSSSDEGSNIGVQAYLASIGLGQHWGPIVVALSRAGFEQFEHLDELQRMMETDEMEDFLHDALILLKAEQVQKVEEAEAAVRLWLETRTLGDSSEAVLLALHQFEYEPESFIDQLETMQNQAELSGFIDDAIILWQAERGEPSTADTLEEGSDSDSEASVVSAMSSTVGGPSAGMYRQQVKDWLMSLGYADDYHSVLSAFDRAGYEPASWRTELQVLHQNGELDEFIRVAKGDLGDNEDRDSHRSEELSQISKAKGWLEDKGLAAHSDSVLDAFERAGYEPECWLDELESLQSEGVLQEFIAAVSKTGSEVESSQQVKARVLFDFEKEDPQELGLKQGEVVIVLSQGDEWWTGYKESDGSQSTGEFPASYVEILKVYPGPAPTHSRPDHSMSLMLPEGSTAYWRSNVRDWLRDKELQDHCKHVLQAFEKAGYSEREWVNELKAMERNGELEAFIGAVGGRMQRSVTAPAGTLHQMISPTPKPSADAGSESSNSKDASPENGHANHLPNKDEVASDSESSGPEDENPGPENSQTMMAEGVPPATSAKSDIQGAVGKMQAVVANAVQIFKQAHDAETQAVKCTTPDGQLEKLATACELYSDGIEQLDTGIDSGVFTGAVLSKLENRRDTMQARMNEVEKKYQSVEAALAAAQSDKVRGEAEAAIEQVRNAAEDIAFLQEIALAQQSAEHATEKVVSMEQRIMTMMEQSQAQADAKAAANEAAIAAQLAAAQAAVEKAQRDADQRVAEAQAAMQEQSLLSQAESAKHLTGAQVAVELIRDAATQELAASKIPSGTASKLQILRSELADTKLTVLKQRARSLGVDNNAIDDADDEDDVRAAVIRLIFAKEEHNRKIEEHRQDERQAVAVAGSKSTGNASCGGRCDVCGNSSVQYGTHHPAFVHVGQIDDWTCDLCDKEFTHTSGLGYGNLYCCAEFEVCDWAACASCTTNQLVKNATAEAKRRHASQAAAIADIQKLAKEEQARILEQDKILDQMFDLDGPENEADMQAAEEAREQAEMKSMELAKKARQMQRQLEREMKLSKETVQRQLQEMKVAMAQARAEAEQARAKAEASAADADVQVRQLAELSAMSQSQATEAERRAEEAEQTALDLEDAMIQTLDGMDEAAKTTALQREHARRERQEQQEIEAAKLTDAATRAEEAERHAAAMERKLADMEAKAKADAVAAAKKADEETARQLQKAEEERIAAAEQAAAAVRNAEQERAEAQRKVEEEKAAETQRLKEEAEKQAAELQQRIAQMEAKAQAEVEAAAKLAAEETERKVAELQQKMETDAQKRAAEIAAMERKLADMEAKAKADAVAAAKKADEETARQLQKAEEQRTAALRKAEQERAEAQRKVEEEKAAETQRLKEEAEKQAAEAERKMAELRQKAEEDARQHAKQAAEAERKLAEIEAKARVDAKEEAQRMRAYEKMQAVVANAVQIFKQAHDAETQAVKCTTPDDQLEKLATACELYSDGIEQLDTGIDSGVFTGAVLSKLENRRDTMQARMNEVEKKYQSVEAQEEKRLAEELRLVEEQAAEEASSEDDEDDLAGLDDLDDLMGGLDDSDEDATGQEATEPAEKDGDEDGTDDMAGLDDLDDMMSKLEDSDNEEDGSLSTGEASQASLGGETVSQTMAGIDDIKNIPSDSSSASDDSSSSSETDEEPEPLNEAAAAREAEEEMKILAMRRRGRSGVAAIATVDDRTAKVEVGTGNNKFYVQQIRGWLRHRGFAHFTDCVITALEKDATLEPAEWLDELGRLESSSALKPFLEKAAGDRARLIHLFAS
jgi:hypothetical protein